MAERIISLSPEEVERMLKSGEMKIISTPGRVDYVESDAPSANLDRAKKLFGENFLGEEAIHTFEKKCKAREINVEFEIPDIPFPYSIKDLEEAVKDAVVGKERILLLRPSWMKVKGERREVNILNLRDLFKTGFYDVVYSNNPFGEGPVFHKTNWYRDAALARHQLNPGYALPTKDLIPFSKGKTYTDQNDLIETGERRRTAVEAVWDLLLYYARRGDKLFEDRHDWTQTITLNGGFRSSIGWIPNNGIFINGHSSISWSLDRGVVLSR